MAIPTIDDLARRLDRIEIASHEWEDLSQMMYGDAKRGISGVLPSIQELRIEVIKLRSAIAYLRLMTALLFVMVFFALLIMAYLVQAVLP